MSFNKNQRRGQCFSSRASSRTPDTSHMSFNKNQRRANAFPPELRLTHRTRPTWALTRIREEPMLFLQSFVSHTQDTSHMSFNKNQRRGQCFSSRASSRTPDTSHMSFNKNQRRANAFPPELRLTHRTRPTWALTRIREEANAFPPELRLAHRTRPTWALTRIREEPMLFLQSFVSHTQDTSHMSFNKNQRRANAFPPELRLAHRTRPTWALTRIREEPMLFLQSFVSHTQDTSHMSFNTNRRRAKAFPPELRLSHTGHVPHEL